MRDFLKDNAIAILAALLAVALAVAAVMSVRVYGFSVGPLHFEGLQAKADRAATEAKDAKAAAELSEGLRGQEQAQAQASFSAAADRCTQRVTTATDAGRAIGEIVNAPFPITAPGGAVPVADRPIVTADRLRVIIGQAAAGSAAGVSGGGDRAAHR